MIEALKCFDKDGNGLVNVNELVFYLTKMGNEQLTDGKVYSPSFSFIPQCLFETHDIHRHFL